MPIPPNQALLQELLGHGFASPEREYHAAPTTSSPRSPRPGSA